MPPEMQFVNLYDFEAAARERLSRAAFNYFAGGAHDEITVRENKRAYDRIALRYRVLVDVSQRDVSTTILGHRLAVPILIAPMAFQRLAHPDGEVATAHAAQSTGSLFVLSTLSSSTVEEVRGATDGPLWFQLYVYRDRAVTRSLVERVEAAGYQARWC